MLTGSDDVIHGWEPEAADRIVKGARRRAVMQGDVGDREVVLLGVP